MLSVHSKTTEQGKQIGLNNGIEGLIKIIQSNRTSSNIIRDYAKVVFKDRLDILLSPTTTDPREYNTISPFYKDIIKLADKEYDLVLVDIDKRMEANDKNAILQEVKSRMWSISYTTNFRKKVCIYPQKL